MLELSRVRDKLDDNLSIGRTHKMGTHSHWTSGSILEQRDSWSIRRLRGISWAPYGASRCIIWGWDLGGG
jgi:hypothetical protein